MNNVTPLPTPDADVFTRIGQVYDTTTKRGRDVSVLPVKGLGCVLYVAGLAPLFIPGADLHACRDGSHKLINAAIDAAQRSRLG